MLSMLILRAGARPCVRTTVQSMISAVSVREGGHHVQFAPLCTLSLPPAAVSDLEALDASGTVTTNVNDGVAKKKKTKRDAGASEKKKPKKVEGSENLEREATEGTVKLKKTKRASRGPKTLSAYNFFVKSEVCARTIQKIKN